MSTIQEQASACERYFRICSRSGAYGRHARRYAQTQTATLQGRVEGAAAGTQVVATDNNTGRKVTGTVDATGNYTILGLTPGTYTVTVEGRDAQQTTLLVGQTAIVDFVPPSHDRRWRGRRHRPPFA